MQKIIQSLKNRELWRPINKDALNGKFLNSLGRPRLVLSDESKLHQVTFDQNKKSLEWLMLIKANPLPRGPVAIMFEDPGHHQFVIISGPCKPTANYAEAGIQQVFQSRYQRKNTRFNAEQTSIFVNEISVLGTDIDPEALKTRLDIIFKSNQKSLEKSVDKVKIAIYNAEKDDNIVKAVQKSNKAVFVEDTSNLENFNKESAFNFGGHKIYFARYLELTEHLPYDLVKLYRDRRLDSELILPILFKVTDEKIINLGYVRINKKKENTIGWDKVMYGALSTIETILTTIKSSNYKVIPGSAPVLDISLGGIKIMVNEPEIIRSLTHSDVVIARINFPDSPPLTSKLKIIFSVPHDGAVVVGLKFLDIKMAEGREAAKEVLRKEVKKLPLLV